MLEPQRSTPKAAAWAGKYRKGSVSALMGATQEAPRRAGSPASPEAHFLQLRATSRVRTRGPTWVQIPAPPRRGWVTLDSICDLLHLRFLSYNHSMSQHPPDMAVRRAERFPTWRGVWLPPDEQGHILHHHQDAPVLAPSCCLASGHSPQHMGVPRPQPTAMPRGPHVGHWTAPQTSALWGSHCLPAPPGLDHHVPPRAPARGRDRGLCTPPALCRIISEPWLRQRHTCDHGPDTGFSAQPCPWAQPISHPLSPSLSQHIPLTNPVSLTPAIGEGTILPASWPSGQHPGQPGVPMQDRRHGHPKPASGPGSCPMQRMAHRHASQVPLPSGNKTLSTRPPSHWPAPGRLGRCGCRSPAARSTHST
uniref:Uncharacterized protein n=1 Tax=Mustela putorius furo TaxID=9669 RepID=M3Z4U1_MUSPF